MCQSCDSKVDKELAALNANLTLTNESIKQIMQAIVNLEKRIAGLGCQRTNSEGLKYAI